MKEEFEKENPTCLYGDVHDPSEWDKFDYDKPSAAYDIETDEAEQEVIIAVTKTPELGRRLRTNVIDRIGFTDAETKRHISAMVLVEMVMNSLEWRTAVLKCKFTTTNKTATQVYDHMMTGEEVLQKGHDYEMDAVVEMYYKKNNVVGYTYSNTTKTWLNRYVTDDYTEEEIAGNFLHEWLHKLGYGHASADDHSSVPYQLGYLIRDMIKNYKKGILKFTDLYPEVVVSPPVIVVPETPTTPAIETPPIKIPVPTPPPKLVCRRSWRTLWLIKVCNYEK